MNAFLGTAPQIKNLTLLQVKPTQDGKTALVEFELYNAADDFDIDFSLLVEKRNNKAIFEDPSLVFSANEADENDVECINYLNDNDVQLDNVAFTPYSKKGVTKLLALDCQPNGIGRSCYLYEDYDSEGGTRRLLSMFNKNRMLSAALQSLVVDVHTNLLKALA